MPEPKNPKPRQPRRKPVNTEQAQANLCHIHDEVYDWEVDEIHKNMCFVSDTFKLTEFEGRKYCLIHLPTNEKPSHLFKELFEKSLKKNKFNDFRYWWFPTSFNIYNQVFVRSTNFRNATFGEECVIDKASFENPCDFTETTFLRSSYFRNCDFVYEALFIQTRFTEPITFLGTQFNSETHFDSSFFDSEADFSFTKFNSHVFFTKTRFSRNEFTSFENATFEKDCFFEETKFRSYTSFDSTIFGKDSDIYFQSSFIHNEFDFRFSSSEGYLRFSNLRQGKDCKFDFQEAAFEKASRVSFHTLKLEPNWFVNVDSRKFVFTDIDWGKTIKWRTGRSFWEKLKFAAKCIASGFRQVFWKSDEILSENIDGELKRLENRGIKDQKKRLLEIACRQLAVNAEENNRYSEASQFRYMAMETKRLENKGIWRFLNLHWFYKWTSGYGESWRRAFVVLVAILAIFGFLYATPLAKFDYGEKPPKKVESFVQKVCDLATMKGNAGGLNGCDSAFYSLAVSALQKPEPKPADAFTKILVILQTILAPLQAALLALAIRRKFMR